MEAEQKVLVVLNGRGNCIHAGNPETFDKKILGKYAVEGYVIKTVSLDDYLKLKWYDQ